MNSRNKGDKGFKLEELLRAYFLRAGFFAVRGVPFQHGGEDLTDIDIWLYERPTGSSRRRQIVDAKSKTKPKAMERLLWTKGLAQLLEVDGAYVATTDARPMLRDICKKLGISILDGSDLKRIAGSDKVIYSDRLTEEELLSRIAAIDRTRRGRELQLLYHDIKFSLIDNFGAGTINRAVESVGVVASLASTFHPDSDSAQVAVRLTYFTAAIVVLSLDFLGAEFSFRTADERRAAFVNAIRYGHPDATAGLERMRLAIALFRKYSANGEATGRAVETAILQDLQGIPAEIIADHVVKHTKPDGLFQIAKKLEHHAFSRVVPSFDILELEEKSFIAALLDYAGVERSRFASSWSSHPQSSGSEKSDPDEMLFPPHDLAKMTKKIE